MVRLFGRAEQRRHELLSAYVDGEVTAEEAREVEELLTSSEDARRELAELQATLDLVRGLPDLGLPRSFALDAAPKKGWTLWWPSVRMTGLATSVATMLLVALVAGDMLDVLGQAQTMYDEEYASDSTFVTHAAPASAAESAVMAAMDAPASPEPEAVVMKSLTTQEESADAPAAPAPAAAAPRMAAAKVGEEPVAAMQQDTSEEATQAMAAQSSGEPVAAMQQDTTEEATQAMAAQSSEEPPVAMKQSSTQDAPVTVDEIQAVEVFDDPEEDGITLPLVELQVVAALTAVVLGGTTIVAIRRRRRSVP